VVIGFMGGLGVIWITIARGYKDYVLGVIAIRVDNGYRGWGLGDIRFRD